MGRSAITFLGHNLENFLSVGVRPRQCTQVMYDIDAVLEVGNPEEIHAYHTVDEHFRVLHVPVKKTTHARGIGSMGLGFART